MALAIVVRPKFVSGDVCCFRCNVPLGSHSFDGSCVRILTPRPSSSWQTPDVPEYDIQFIDTSAVTVAFENELEKRSN